MWPVPASRCVAAAGDRVGDVVGDRRRSQHRPRRHRVGDVRRSRRSVPHGRAGGRRARQGRGRVPGRRRQHAPEPDARVSRAAEGHRPEGDHRAAERRSGVPVAAVRHRRSAGTQRRTLGSRRTATCRRTFTARCRAPRSSIRFRATSCGPAGRAERRAGVSARQRRDHRSRDGGDGSRRRIGRRQPLHLPAVADRRLEAGDSVRREDRARRLHPDGGEGRHQRRLAQQRQVHDVPHRVAAGAGSRAERDPAKART